MDIALDLLIKLYLFTAGRRLLALRKVKKIAESMRLDRLVAHIDKALAHDRHTRELDMRWSGRKSGNRDTSPMQEVDNLADSALSGLRDGAMALTRGARPGEPIHDKVEAFLNELMPAGVYAITSQPYPDQCAALEVMENKLQGPLAPMVEELGLGRQAKRLIELTREYRSALESYRANDDILFAEVDAARKRGQRYLLEVVAIILGTFPESDNPQHMAARASLLGPILEENEAIRVYQRARRSRGGGADTGDLGDLPPDEPGLDDDLDDGQGSDLDAGLGNALASGETGAPAAAEAREPELVPQA